MSEPSPDDVTRLLERVSDGQPSALDELLPLVYGELRRQAARYLRRERGNHTLQPTALVNEAFMRLVGQRDTRWQNRAHFFGVAAQAMRRILVDHARGQVRLKRGGRKAQVTLEDHLLAGEMKGPELIDLDNALRRLEELDPRQAKVVELRFFGELGVEETAEVMQISPATVKREWSMAKAWLFAELKGQP